LRAEADRALRFVGAHHELQHAFALPRASNLVARADDWLTGQIAFRNLL
jgi:hypothetical protein